MSLFVLDTDIVSLFQHDHPRITAEVQRHLLAELAITVLTVEVAIAADARKDW